MGPAPAPDRLLRRLHVAAFGMDAAAFLLLAAVPYKILALGGTSLELGAIPAVSAVTYIAVTLLAGRWSDRIGRARLAQAGGVTLLLFVPLAVGARSLTALAAAMPWLGLSTALFWPPAQAAVGDLAGGAGGLARGIGRFNVAWCLGKACGYFCGGLLLARWSPDAAFAAGGALGALALLGLPRTLPAPVEGATAAAAAGAAATVAAGVTATTAAGAAAARGPAPLALSASLPPPRVRERYRRLAWLANFAAYGAAGVLNHQLPKWFAARGWSEGWFGLFVGATFLSQAACFALLAARVRFSYSLPRLLLPQAGAAVAMALLPLLPSWLSLLALAPVLGVSFGLSYTASLYASLDAPSGKGRNAGIHESLVGAGTFLLPLLGGAVARFGGWLAAPYLLSSAWILAALGLQLAWWRRRPRP